MIFEQHYLSCLSQASYLIGDETTGRAVVVDPRRDVGIYLESAKDHGLAIELVLETHFHADFLSGHLEVADATGAAIGYGSVAETEFPSTKFADGERISLGEVELEILHTPGHTPESISVVVREHSGDTEPYAVLTGDTLFIGDVGRPDLLSSVGVTSDELARMLYDSLHQKLMTLPDATRVYPAHGAGSSCGKNLSSDTWSTIGAQRSSNYALAPMSQDEFVAVVTEGQTSPPSYFSYDATLNRELRELLDEESDVPALSPAEVAQRVAAGAVIVDTREPVDFAAGHPDGAINIGMSGRFAEFAGGIIEPGREIVIVAEPGAATEARNRLARIGFDSVVGHLSGPVDEPLQAVPSSRLDVAGLQVALESLDNLQLVDVRQPGETIDGVIEGAVCVPLTELNARIDELDPARPTVVYCAGGFRSMIAGSRLENAGFNDVSDLLGGYGAWDDAGRHAEAQG